MPLSSDRLLKLRPQSAAPSPVSVGFSCALCHSTQLSEGSDQKSEIHYGPGSISLNLFAWLDAFQAAILEREPLPPNSTFDPAPAHVDAIHVPGVWIQIHHPDIEYYDRYFQNSLTLAHPAHCGNWH